MAAGKMTENDQFRTHGQDRTVKCSAAILVI